MSDTARSRELERTTSLALSPSLWPWRPLSRSVCASNWTRWSASELPSRLADRLKAWRARGRDPLPKAFTLIAIIIIVIVILLIILIILYSLLMYTCYTLIYFVVFFHSTAKLPVIYPSVWK